MFSPRCLSADLKCPRLFLSPDMRVRGGIVLVQSSSPPLYTNVTLSSKSFDSLNINLQYGLLKRGKPLNKTNK